MTLAASVRAQARNNAWSNHRLHAACARLDEPTYRAARVSFFPSIPPTLSHILLVDWYYLDALEGGGKGYGVFDDVGDEPYATLTELTSAQRAADRRLIASCDGRADRDLASIVVLDRPERGSFPEPALAVLNHLFTHQIHHRGQVHAMLAGSGSEPPQLDEFFLAGRTSCAIWHAWESSVHRGGT
ncbi:MAG: damage-inducible protein DinB [Alphaproteobacteria bacterium]|nr:damage-inducible protein DinB [Alphaproteobacteria bacterium]